VIALASPAINTLVSVNIENQGLSINVSPKQVYICWFWRWFL